MILPLEKQVCSLELARRLKKLRVPQKSTFYWFGLGYPTVIWKLCDRVLPEETIKGWKFKEKNEKEECLVSAFTVAELGIFLNGYTNRVSFNSVENKWRVYFDIGQETLFETEANARAEILIHLIEEGRINPNAQAPK